jgi:hypothetical protein
MSTTTEESHALHWGWRENEYGTLELWGRVVVAGRAMVTEDRRTPSLVNDVTTAALNLRNQVAEKLGCAPTRINFIDGTYFSQEPVVNL